METLHERSFAYDDDNDRFGINASGNSNSNSNTTNNSNTNNANTEKPADSDVDVLRDRLNLVRKAVHKATQEALKQANGHSPSLSSLQKENASFLLGMDLFGSSGGGGMDTGVYGGDNVVTGSSGLELTVRDKLEQVERDLSRIQKESDALPSSALASTLSAAENSGDGVNANNNNIALSGKELSDQIENYRRKVTFLRQASLARSCLEESTALTSSASSSTAGAGSAAFVDNEGGNTTAATISDNSNLVRSAQTLLRALKEVDEAERILRDDLSSVGDSNNMTENKKQQKEIEVAHRILSSLRHQIRRHRVELVHKAGTVLDGSVELTPGSIAVKSSEQLTVAYKVLETLDDAEQAASRKKSKTTALQETLRGFTEKLYKEALKPILATMSSESNSIWKVDESSDKRSKMIGVSTANKRGTTHRIEWILNDDSETLGDGMGENGIIEEEGEEPSSFAVVNSWKNILDVFRRILTFVKVKVFLERETLCAIVGKRLFGTPDAMPSIMNLAALGLKSELLGENDLGVLGEAMVKQLRDQSLSQAKIALTLDRVSLLGEELLELALPFCQELESFYDIPSIPPSRLVVFCKDFEKAFIDHRRSELLNEARDILMKNDYHNTTIVGVAENPSPEDTKEEALAVFRLSRCSVSDTANKLVSLVRKTMDECVSVVGVPHDSPLAVLRPTLYKTAREMFSLYRTIIPANHGREVANVPRTAAVLHNDAVFLAHHCLTLGLEYKEKFPVIDEDDARGKLLKQTCLFVDMVPLFRELADTSLNDMLDLQKHQLAEIVGSRITYFGQSLRSDESVHEWSEAETALAAGIYHLRHLAQAWNPILSKPVFLRSMGYLADVLFSLFLREVTTNGTVISRSAKQFASTLFRKAAFDVNGLLFEGKQQQQQQHDDPTKYALEWGRFEAVGSFLDLDQLVQVEQALSLGGFRNLESAELAKLVTATYKDAPQRRALLNCMASVV
jgi:centromere/kinetochore protein ZW10